MLIHIPLLEALLEPHADALGDDAIGYRNHVYRIVNLGWSLGRGDDAAFEQLVIAAAFHDLGLWTAGSFDYLAPSRALARAHLRDAGRDEWIDTVDAMIDNHHRVRRWSHDVEHPVERFRRADWSDVSGGLLRNGFDRRLIASLRHTFPSCGFHCGLARRALRRLATHPLDPLPMLRW